MIRNPVVAGQFYPASPKQLKAMIEKMVDEKAAKEEVVGLLATIPFIIVFSCLEEAG